jgi:hypothetical protein
MSRADRWETTGYMSGEPGDPGRPTFVFNGRDFLRYLNTNGGYDELIEWAYRGCDPPVFHHAGFTWVYSPGPVPSITRYES